MFENCYPQDMRQVYCILKWNPILRFCIILPFGARLFPARLLP